MQTRLQAGFQTLKSYVTPQLLLHPLVLLLGALAAHYLSAHYYASYCTPWGVWGFIQTLWKVETVQCKASRWLFSYSYNYIHHLWLSVGGVCVVWVMKWFKIKQ